MDKSQEGLIIKLSVEEKSALCLKCMECCKSVVIPTPWEITGALTTTAIILYKTRGFTTFFQDRHLHLEADIPCKYLSLKTGCTIYEDRPAACRIYDGTKHPRMRDKCLWGKVQDGYILPDNI